MEDVTIPSSVTEIGNSAFSNSKLKKVINLTGEKFKWFEIVIRGTGGYTEEFEIGTVTNGSRTIEITNQ